MQPMATFEASKSNTRLTQLINGQTVAVWMEDKSSGPAVYAQNFTFEGNNNGVVEGTNSNTDSNKVSIRPNPACDLFHISIPSDWSQDIEVCLYQISGTLIGCQSLPEGHNQGSIAWDVSALPSGLYIVEVDTGGKEPPAQSPIIVAR